MFAPYFLRIYLEYNAGNEVPRNFHIWSALSLLSATANHKVYISQGYFIHRANIFACLVGEQGDRKSTAKDIARDILVETFPDMPVAPSVTTRERITQFLGSDESIRTYKDENGVIVEYHPYVMFINELKNFLSVNPGGMIDFLTDIYDRKHFKVETKNKGIDTIENPCLTVLACETPVWIIRKMKEDLITGGFSRRMIMVYEREQGEAKPRPQPPSNARDLLQRIQAHLKKVSLIIGGFKWTPDGAEFFDKWYVENKRTLPTDPVMRGYRKTKDVQLLKICMLLALCEEEPKLLISGDLLEAGLALLDSIEMNMPRLSIAAGRNELAVPQQRVLELLEANGGEMPEKVLLRETSKDLSPQEQYSVLRFLAETEQIVKVPRKVGEVNRVYIQTRERVLKDAKQRSNS